MKDFANLVSRTGLRMLLEEFRAEGRGDRITTAELTDRYNAQTAGRALTVNLFGRALAAHGIGSTPSWDRASKKMARCIVVLDACGSYLPEFRQLFEGDPTPDAGEKSGSVSQAPLEPGDRFWEWTVIDPSRRIEYGGRMRRAALVGCTCSTPENVVEKVITWDHLRSGNTKSCGHYRREIGAERIQELGLDATTHGLSGHPLHKIWGNMLQRCHNPANDSYRAYGGRGISVYPEWRADFQAFFDHVAQLVHCGEPGYTLDRIDNDGNYEPGNVKFSTKTQQNVNQRRNMQEFTGVRQTKGSNTWEYRVGRDGARHEAYGFESAEDARDARQAKICEMETVAGASGLRDGDVYAVHGGRLVLIVPADAEDVTGQDRAWLQGLLEYALEDQAAPTPEATPDCGGTLASAETLGELHAKLSGKPDSGAPEDPRPAKPGRTVAHRAA